MAIVGMRAHTLKNESTKETKATAEVEMKVGTEKNEAGTTGDIQIVTADLNIKYEIIYSINNRVDGGISYYVLLII
ncbi:hypothetical protein V7111_25450 [Neobacillus niacini]|uniref:hypothetical protein n=1 Tax=Neobacillus niacini TaxID=86668 RepID=UPI00300120F5